MSANKPLLWMVEPNDRDLWNKISFARYLSEFIGTFWLVLTIAFVTSPNAQVPGMLGAFAVASVLTTLIYMGGPVAKAQYNPAVTMMFVIHGTFTWAQGLIYVVVQLLAALLAAMLGFGLTESSSIPGPKGIIADKPGSAVVIEALYTFVLVEIICIVALARPHSNNGYYAPAIALAVLGGAISVGGLTGAVFNPCVGFGLILGSAALYGTPTEDLWIYWVGPILGSLMAYAAYRGMYVAELNKQDEPAWVADINLRFRKTLSTGDTEKPEELMTQKNEHSAQVAIDME